LQLKPRLEKIVASYNGALLLAKVDAEAEPQLSQAFGVRSLPTVVLIKGGQPVDGFMGAVTDAQIRQFLDRHVVAAPAEEAIVDESAGPDWDAKILALNEKIRAEPEQHELKQELAQALIKVGEAEAATAVIAALPDKLQADKTTERLRSQIALLNSLPEDSNEASLLKRLAANADDHQARLDLATLTLLGGDPEAGLQQYLEVLKRDRNFNEGAPRKALIAAFDLLDDGDLISTYRKKMASILF
jgi:putative thioredoxin